VETPPTAGLNPPPILAAGAIGAMRRGNAGIHGDVGIGIYVSSCICRISASPNPTLSANKIPQ
jgi:hypothetical protein